jgi:hypothetical protein
MPDAVVKDLLQLLAAAPGSGPEMFDLSVDTRLSAHSGKHLLTLGSSLRAE